MKLGRVNPTQLDRRREPHAILTPGDPDRRRTSHRWGFRSQRLDVRSGRTGIRSHTRLFRATLSQSRPHGPRYNRIKRMHEIEAGARRDAVEQREIARMLHEIPSHVWDLLAGW